jgi:hypothetical protein
MSNFSRSKKFEDLHREIQNDNEGNIQSNELSQYANKLNEIDSNNFDRMNQSYNQDPNRARNMEVNPMYQQPAPIQNQNYYQEQQPMYNPQPQQNQPQGPAHNDYMNEFINEVKDYNMKQGLRTAEDTQINILNEIRGQNTPPQQQNMNYQYPTASQNVPPQGYGNPPIYPQQNMQQMNQVDPYAQQRPIEPQVPQQQTPVDSFVQQPVPMDSFTSQQPVPIDPFAQQQVGIDPFTQQQSPSDPFGAHPINDPFMQQNMNDPFAPQAPMDPFALQTQTGYQAQENQPITLKNQDQISSEIERFMTDPNYIPVPEVEQQITGAQPQGFEALQQQYLADMENQRQQKMHDEMLMETQQLKVQMGEVEDELEEAHEKVTNTNRVLNFILILLILALLVILGIAVYWVLSSKGII